MEKLEYKEIKSEPINTNKMGELGKHILENGNMTKYESIDGQYIKIVTTDRNGNEFNIDYYANNKAEKSI